MTMTKGQAVEIKTGKRAGTLTTLLGAPWRAINGKDYVMVDVPGQNIFLAKNVRPV